jgi:hypothetical protein
MIGRTEIAAIFWVFFWAVYGVKEMWHFCGKGWEWI